MQQTHTRHKNHDSQHYPALLQLTLPRSPLSLHSTSMSTVDKILIMVVDLEIINIIDLGLDSIKIIQSGNGLSLAPPPNRKALYGTPFITQHLHWNRSSSSSRFAGRFVPLVISVPVAHSSFQSVVIAVFLDASLDLCSMFDTHASVHRSSCTPFYSTNFALSDCGSMLLADASSTSLVVAVTGRTNFYLCTMFPAHPSVLRSIRAAIGRAFPELSTVPPAYSSIDGKVGTTI